MMGRRAGVRMVLAAALLCLAASASKTAQAQVKLEFKFAEGKKLTYELTSRARQVLTFMGMEIASVKRDRMVWSQAVGKRRDDASLPLEQKVELFHVEYSLPGEIKLTLFRKTPTSRLLTFSLPSSATFSNSKAELPTQWCLPIRTR